MFINRALKQCLIVAPLSLATACGGSSESGHSPQLAPGSGSFSLAITDGPVDSATKVVVEFSGVTVKPVDGDAVEFTFDEPVTIDLLTLQGQVSQYILAAESLPAGDYEWVRLSVNAEQDGVMDSYIELNDGSQLELAIPSGAETGLKLVSGFTIPEEGDADFTVDFDLRKSIVIKDQGEAPTALLKPALRIVDTISAGSIEGEIDAATVAAQCAAPEVSSGAVYLFEQGKGRADVRGGESDPVASALVKFEDGAYRYELGFVADGEYEVAFTCDAALDDPEAEDQLTFVDASSEGATVTVGENVIVDFIPGETLPKGGDVPGVDAAQGERPVIEKPEEAGKPVIQKPETGMPVELPESGKPENVGKPEDAGRPEAEVPEIGIPEGEVPEVEAPGKPATPGKPTLPQMPETELPEGETSEADLPAPAKPEMPGKPQVPDVDAPQIPEVEEPSRGKPELPAKPATPDVADEPEVEEGEEDEVAEDEPESEEGDIAEDEQPEDDTQA